MNNDQCEIDQRNYSIYFQLKRLVEYKNTFSRYLYVAKLEYKNPKSLPII